MGAPYRYVIVATVPMQPEAFFESYTTKASREGWETFYPGGGQVSPAYVIPQGNVYALVPATAGEVAVGSGGLSGDQMFYQILGASTPDKEFSKTKPLYFRVIASPMNVEHPAFDSGSAMSPNRDTVTEIQNGEATVVLDFVLTPKSLEKDQPGWSW